MTPPELEVGNWNEWARHVLAELGRLDSDNDKLAAKIDDVRERLTKLINDKTDIINLKFDAYGVKLDNLNARVTTLYIKVFGLGAASAILTTLVFLLLSQLLKGK